MIGQKIDKSSVSWAAKAKQLVDERWEYLHSEMHSAGYALDPEFMSMDDRDDATQNDRRLDPLLPHLRLLLLRLLLLGGLVDRPLGSFLLLLLFLLVRLLEHLLLQREELGRRRRALLAEVLADARRPAAERVRAVLALHLRGGRVLAQDLHLVPHAPGASVVALALLAHAFGGRGIARALEPEARGEVGRVRVWEHFVCVV